MLHLSSQLLSMLEGPQRPYTTQASAHREGPALNAASPLCLVVACLPSLSEVRGSDFIQPSRVFIYLEKALSNEESALWRTFQKTAIFQQSQALN